MNKVATAEMARPPRTTILGPYRSETDPHKNWPAAYAAR